MNWLNCTKTFYWNCLQLQHFQAEKQISSDKSAKIVEEANPRQATRYLLAKKMKLNQLTIEFNRYPAANNIYQRWNANSQTGVEELNMTDYNPFPT